jgi:hypothetical protein
MDRFMSDNGWDSEYLRWYVNYCCRDDYGCAMKDVSAWAGIHYFSARSGKAANADPHAVVTWPEGNGWIVNRLSERVHRHIRCSAAVLNIERAGNGLLVDYYDGKRDTMTRINAKVVIYAAPRFTAIRAIKDLRERPPAYAAGFGYVPWMVANIVMEGAPEGKGASLAWDNVSFHSESLGYVVANHQNVSARRDRSVLTYYLPLTSADPEAERRRAISLSFEDWAGMILKDLSRMHPGIERSINELYVWLWGHAMVRPVPGFIWGQMRREAIRPHGNIFFAHSDMSGISLFEEAQYWGIRSSREIMRKLGHS